MPLLSPLPSLAAALVGSLLLSGCTSKPSAEPPGSGGAVHAAWVQNGWSDAERAEYYHLPEGSELMPYALLSNVVSTKTGK